MSDGKSDGKCKVVKNFRAIAALLFKNDDYINRMNELGLTLLFYGFSLIALASSTNPASRGNPDQPESIALELVPEKGQLYPDFERFRRGYPELPLLLKSLKSWDWSSEGRHTLHIQDGNVNIELNIAVYAVGRPVGVSAIPGSHRLAEKYEDEPAENPMARSAICYGKEDPSLELKCCMLAHHKILYFGTIGGRGVIRDFILGYEGRACICDLEERLGGCESTRRNPKEDFELLESNNLLETDDALSGTPQLERAVSHNSAQGRHRSAWRHVFRADSAVARLLRATDGQPVSRKIPERNFFLAGLGVQALYDGDWKSTEVYQIIFGWGPQVRGPTLNYAAFDQANIASLPRTNSSPFICLHARSLYTDQVMSVENLSSYVDNRNGSLTIPILYLRDTDYSARKVAIEYKFTENCDSEPRHAYSFMANGLTVLMAEFDQEREPWHKRSDRERNII